MQVSTELLKAWFTELNDMFFGGELPVPQLKTGNSRTVLGTMSCRTTRHHLLWQRTEYTIRISNYYERSEDEFRNVLLHEMIHYYIAVKRLKDTSSHGRIFRGIMAQVNAKGWHVSVRERGRMTVAERNQKVRKVFLILSLMTDDGQRMFSVVNRNYIGKIEYQLQHTPVIKSWEWRMSDDSYFRVWTQVRTLRLRRVGEAEFNDLTARTSPLKVGQPH